MATAEGGAAASSAAALAGTGAAAAEGAEVTFLTFLDADRKRAAERRQKREDLLLPTDGGQQILKFHGDLQALAEDLDERVESRLTANESAFFLAYKSFMYGVQKELRELKQKADEEETKTRRDLKVQSLEKRLDWFMGEALRLDELCKKQKRDLDKWRGRAEALEDDRAFLENQIKTAKRQNKALRGSVERAQSEAYAALADAPAAGTGTVALRGSPKAASGERPLALPAPEKAGLSAELEARYQKCVRRLKEQLEGEQRTAARLRGAAEKQFAEPSKLEALWLEVVEKVRGEVAARKGAQRERDMGDGKAEHRLVPAKEISVDDFTASDRRRTMELLLGSREVLQFLEEKARAASPASSLGGQETASELPSLLAA